MLTFFPTSIKNSVATALCVLFCCHAALLHAQEPTAQTALNRIAGSQLRPEVTGKAPDIPTAKIGDPVSGTVLRPLDGTQLNSEVWKKVKETVTQPKTPAEPKKKPEQASDNDNSSFTLWLFTALIVLGGFGLWFRHISNQAVKDSNQDSESEASKLREKNKKLKDDLNEALIHIEVLNGRNLEFEQTFAAQKEQAADCSTVFTQLREKLSDLRLGGACSALLDSPRTGVLSIEHSRLDDFGNQLNQAERTITASFAALTDKLSQSEKKGADSKNELVLMRNASQKAQRKLTKLQSEHTDLKEECRKLRLELNETVQKSFADEAKRLRVENIRLDENVRALKRRNIEYQDRLKESQRRYRALYRRKDLAAPTLCDVLDALGCVKSDDDDSVWETPLGRVRIDHDAFEFTAKPNLNGKGALALVARLMQVGQWEALLLLNESLGTGPALAAASEYIKQHLSNAPAVAPAHLIINDPRNSDA